MDRRAHLDGGHLGGQGNEDRDVNQDMNVLGSGSYERSQTKTQRNPNAEKLAENWQRGTQQFFEMQGSSDDSKDVVTSDEDNNRDYKVEQYNSGGKFMKRKESKKNFYSNDRKQERIEDMRNL